MDYRLNFASLFGALLLLVALGMPSAALAQVESFNSAGFPAGWQARQTPANVGDLWAVDANPTTTPTTPTVPLTPYASAPFSLNFNNGTDVFTTLAAPSNAGVITPMYDITFARMPPQGPGPKLRFQEMQHRFFTTAPNYHICEIVVWDDTLTTVFTIVNVSLVAGNFQPWQQRDVDLQAQWGQVRFEFRYHSDFLLAAADQLAAGWFVDDVEVINLLPPAFAITNPPIIPSISAGNPLNVQLAALNNIGPLNNWRITQGTLPQGVTLGQATGLISGTPNNSGNYSFQVAVDDSAVPVPTTAVKWFSVSITRPPAFVYATQNLPFDDDFSTDTGWVFTNDDPPSIAITGPGPLPYSDVSEGGWERGATQQSPQGQWVSDNRDPANDNSTPGNDNMVLGVRVGERWNSTPNLAGLRRYWACSPAINVAGLQLIDVRFWRWLNAHYTEVPARVELWNPASNTWDLIWNSQTSTVDHDNAWTKVEVSHNFQAIPAAGAITRLRFGWWATATAVGGTTYSSGGFNVDDVLVSEKPQPGILVIKQAKIYSTTGPASAPFTWVGQQYPLILEVQNTSSAPVNVTSFEFDFYSIASRIRTPHSVGQFLFTVPPSPATPWQVPGNSSFFISNVPASPGPYQTQFDCLAVAGVSGTTVFFHCVLRGKEAQPAVGQPTARATISDSETDLLSGNTKITPSAPPPVEINAPTVLPAANLGQPYSYTFNAWKGVPPYHSWAMTAGPAWILFNPTTATITGTPPAQQTYQLTVEVWDSALPNNATHSKTFDIPVVNVGPLPIQIVTSSQLPNATESAPYAPLVFNATGGTPPYTWSLVGGTLPNGMTFTAVGATLAGTPNSGTTGAYTFQIRARDNAAPATEVTRTFFLSVLPANTQVAITTPGQGPGSPPGGLETEPYNGGVPFQFAAAGGFVSGPNSYRWTIVGGTFPPGLALDPVTGRVSGTPTAQGQYGFQLRVSDGAFPPSTSEASFGIDIDPLVPVPMFINTNAILPPASESNPYAVQLGATYGKQPLTWRVKTGSALPQGLVLNTINGDISGVLTRGQAATPDEDFTFTIEVRDASSPAQLAEKTFTLNVGAFINGILTIITPEDLPEGGVEFHYSAWLKATGGNPVDPANPYIWALMPGSNLPLGLTLSINGNISGIVPLLEDDTYTFSVNVSDNGGNSTSRTFTLQINDYQKPPEPPPVEIVAGKERVEIVPFWEACSVSAGAGAAGYAAFAAMSAFAVFRRRRVK